MGQTSDEQFYKSTMQRRWGREGYKRLGHSTDFVLCLLHATLHLCAVTNLNAPGLVVPAFWREKWAALLGEEMLSREV